ncbi:protein FAM240C-like [Kryptolebias marmoratus]|uniref:protein FAM240C-like n=1 Tax=Kryptolebias marmoratus TaxID=37003 RepID=UPI000D52F583|nr:protein FAM240C-like [Kryptolebias marmoratus]
MSSARVHDKQKLRSFWEQRIVQHSQQMDQEENRMRSSALTRLRQQWVLRLDQRNQQQQSFFEERRRRVQKAQRLSPEVRFPP